VGECLHWEDVRERERERESDRERDRERDAIAAVLSD